MLSRLIPLSHPVDVGLTLGPLRHGRNDPTIRFAPDGVWRATRTAEGPATVHLRMGEAVVEARVWGEGADALVDRLPGMVGALDVEPFAPEHPLVAELHRRAPGLRIPRTGAVFEALVPAVIEQKVTGFEARRAYHQLVHRFGEPAPGPTDLLVPPRPEVLADEGYYAFHPMGIEKKRADTLRRIAANGYRLDVLADLPLDEARRRLTTILGVGAWTAAEVALVALGDADAVSVGDYHLKNTVSWALAREPRGTDERMLELLEPFRGHRGRVIRLIEAAGIRAPRRGPRTAPRDLERH